MMLLEAWMLAAILVSFMIGLMVGKWGYHERRVKLPPVGADKLLAVELARTNRMEIRK